MNNYYTRYREFISGGLSGVTEVVTTHWIDNLKTRIQETNLDSKKHLTMKDFNYRNLYWGFYPRLFGIIPMRTVFWSSQKISNDYLKQFSFNNNYKYLIAGVFSGSMQTLIDNPIEAMKINLITNQNKKVKINILKGFTPTLLRNSIFCGMFNLIVKNREKDHKLLSGGIGGVVASIVSHPFDVVKTEMQKSGSLTVNSLEFVKDNLAKNPKIFLSGMIPRTILSLATMSIGYFSFSFFMDLIY